MSKHNTIPLAFSLWSWKKLGILSSLHTLWVSLAMLGLSFILKIGYIFPSTYIDCVYLYYST